MSGPRAGSERAASADTENLTVEAEETTRRLAQAESNVARTLHRLQQIRRASLEGRFDPQEYDRALLAYRQAEHESRAARRAWAQARGAAAPAPVPAGAPAPAPPAPDVPFQPTPRMRFLRWLVQQGRLSEWDVAD
ncbi:MAG TPA: hypothetical protein VH257_17910 [Chloroflexota bacterium]|jgi:hypothetical protein|nr:hypothetical protein [Chloroflexota bacterium]